MNTSTTNGASTSRVTLTSEAVDDLLYCARAGETTDFVAYLDELVDTHADKVAAKQSIVEQANDEAGNGMVHYACANGHLETFEILSPLLTFSTILLQNSSGNTPLHWAGLNGHLPLVQALLRRITELEKQNPDEARRINVLKHEEEEAAARAKRQKEQAEASSSADTDNATATAARDNADADADAPSAPDRSIWDIRNHFGRGPTSESQMNGKEDVVVYLLGCMGAGGAEAGPAPQPSQERVDEEPDTPALPQKQGSAEPPLESKASELSVRDDHQAS